MNSIDVRTLPLSSKVGLTWSFVWRAVLTTVASSLTGGLLGGVVGFVLGGAGFPVAWIRILSGIAGVVTGLVFSYVYVQWLLLSPLGCFRLQLVRTDDRA